MKRLPARYNWVAGPLAGVVYYVLMILDALVFGDDPIGEAAKSSIPGSVFFTIFMTLFFFLWPRRKANRKSSAAGSGEA